MRLREKREYPGIKMSDFLKIDLSRYENFKINIGNNHMSGFDWVELDNYEDMILYNKTARKLPSFRLANELSIK